MFSSVTSLFKLVSKNSSFIKQPFESVALARTLYLTSPNHKVINPKGTLRELRYNYKERTEPNTTDNIDDISSTTLKIKDHFPNENTPDTLFDGIPYKYLPIFNIKAGKNNTIISATDYKGMVMDITSSGKEGFKNARKGTTIAAQTAAFELSKNAVKKGIKSVRLRVQGIGMGRAASVKGIESGGINIVSITDNTHVSWTPPRPKKRRRI